MHGGKGCQIHGSSREDGPSFRVASFRHEALGERKTCRQTPRMLCAVRAFANRDGAVKRDNCGVDFAFARVRFAERLAHRTRAIHLRRRAGSGSQLRCRRRILGRDDLSE